MTRLSHLVLIISMNALICVLAEKETYPKEYDNIDTPAIMQNDSLRDDYHKCFMEIAPCKSPEMKTLTEIFSEAIQTECKKCTEKQKESVKLIRDWYIKNEPKKWQQILAKSEEHMKKKNANQ